jgi:hypothetical protein
VKPPFVADHPTVEATTLKGERNGYAILVNHGAEARKVTVRSTLPLHSIVQLRPEGARPLTLTGAQWQMDLAPYEGAIVDWHQAGGSR